MNRNSNRRIHPIAEADGLSPKKHRKLNVTRIGDKKTADLHKPTAQLINSNLKPKN